MSTSEGADGHPKRAATPKPQGDAHASGAPSHEERHDPKVAYGRGWGRRRHWGRRSSFRRRARIFGVRNSRLTRARPGTLPSSDAVLVSPRDGRPRPGLRQLNEVRVALPRARRQRTRNSQKHNQEQSHASPGARHLSQNGLS